MSARRVLIVDAETALDIARTCAPPWPAVVSITDTPSPTGARSNHVAALHAVVTRWRDAHVHFAVFDDVTATRHGYIPMSRLQVERLLAFARRPGVRVAEHVIVHCLAGLSRSPAVAVAMFAAQGMAPVDAVRAMRDAVHETCRAGFREDEFVSPNAAVIVRADDALQLRGALIAAVIEVFPRGLQDFAQARGGDR